jgi:predicted DNA-binding transcriptional regulator YafY
MPPKNSDATPAEKILSLYTLLLINSGRYFSLTELAERLECSKQTVLRLVDQIEMAEFGKITRDKRGREAVYAIERPQRLPLMSVNAEGLYQLALCRNLLLHLLPKGIKTQVDKTLREIGSHIDEAVAPDDITMGQPYTKGSIDYTPFQQMLKTVTQAIQTRVVCLVSYQRQLGSPPNTFEYAPKRLISYHESLIILGWHVTEKGKARALYDNPATLYLHRCRDIALTRRGTEHLPDAEPAQKGDGHALFGVMRGEVFPVRVRFAPEAATYVYERRWSSRQECTRHDDGAVTLDFDAQSQEEVVAWVLGFGERATLLSPQNLAQEVARQGEAIAAKYRDEAGPL